MKKYWLNLKILLFSFIFRFGKLLVKNRIYLFLGYCWFLFFVLISPVFAQSISLSISPPLIEVVIKPQKSIMVAYNLQNNGDPVIAQVKVVSFEPKDNFGNIKLKDELEGPIRFSLDNADLQLNQPFFLKTKDKQQLLLRIRAPEGAPEGDYYYTLLVETQPPPGFEGKTSNRVKATIGSNILITVTNSGKIEVKSKIVLFDVLPRFKFNLGSWLVKLFDSNDKIPVVLIAQNQGKNLIKPEGEIILRGNFGETAKYQILPQNILSQSQRLLTATPSAEIICPEKGTQPKYCRQPITLLLSGFFLGKYNLSTEIYFGENTPKIFSHTAFIALPFKLIFAFLTSLIVGILVFKRFF
ncbi:MAG: hypothetical protein ACPL1D_01750 [Microgenomates group bacterium]